MPDLAELHPGETHRFRSTRYAFGIPAGMDDELTIDGLVLDGVQLGILLPQLPDGSFPPEQVSVRRPCGCRGG